MKLTRAYRVGMGIAAIGLAACGGGMSGTEGAQEVTGNPVAPPATTTPPPTTTAPATPAQRVTQLETQRILPTLDRSTDIRGTDANNNGVRDDVDAFIAARYTAELQRKAATQFARNLQSMLLVDKANASAVKSLSFDSMRATRCLVTQFPNTAGAVNVLTVMEDLAGITTNTLPRLKAHVEFSRAIDGTVMSLPEGNSCE